MSPSSSYGYTYLTSYGWTGTGTALRKGAIAKPLTIPQKKSLSGLGRDRDEAFPFWDHLFTAAAKAITINVSSDDEDADETEDLSPSGHSDSASTPLARTTTGILSNRRPVSGTPASASGSTTPSLIPDANANISTDVPGAGARRSSLLTTAKREAAKRGLYARFFRGPVLGPVDGPDARAGTGAPSLAPLSSSSSPEPPSLSRTIPEHPVGDSAKNKKRKSEDRSETKEERRERKRLKRERGAARAAKTAEKASAGDETKKKKDRKARKHWEETRSESDATAPYLKKASKKSVKGSVPKGSGVQPASTNDGQQDTCSHRPPGNLDTTSASNVALATKKKKGKRKNTLS